MASSFTRKQPSPRERKKPKVDRAPAPAQEGPEHAGPERWRDVDVERWLALFSAVEAAALEGGAWPPLRRCAMAWHVAGILYERHQRPALTDAAYDALSRYLLENLDAALATGAWLEAADLRAGTAMGWRAYPGPAHDVAFALDAGRCFDQCLRRG